ncbi:Pal1 family protein [Aspergillus clavatus NRRL 1]|uniref:Pal1 cell morphology protein n=1 Tax=Aspergillus clavatus (strain ATCC 1007 / CBS 513.65 / DSM 816 / NCTC 3887 / NRRL 1 / QM 1276 / 107) TaxID=344612 RepID=A1CL93_ASPCL|nr:uncharacterized protein ACLA_041350 [Aspergillus clavatus NRRL 1]EAW09917.1 conserved hypothetical protein [Aspergillus clavatus NRRL 1]
MNASQHHPTLSYPFPPGVSLGQAPAPDGQISPQLAVHLASNNPFRNRALSPANSTRPERPTSTNPFLDDNDSLSSPRSAPIQGTLFSPIEQQDMTSNTRDLFENLSLNSQTQNNGHRTAPPPPGNGFSKLPSNTRPPPASRDRQDQLAKDPFDIFADPPLTKTTSRSGASRDRERERERRPRRNSESSVMDRPKMLDPEDEKRRRERRRREREAGRPRDGKSSRSKKSNYQLDIIDKLDVTSIYGTGMFHHDGPFDACNPHRNRKGSRTAPMQAFPEDSSNMALGGAGPNNKNINLDLFHGTMEEGFNDYGATAALTGDTVNFDPKARIEPIHGAESMGLGTSTFLEGAPASRAAMQRRTSENENQFGQGGGLQRKKSLAQRLRGMNRPPGGRMVSPDASYNAPFSSSQSGSLRTNERNPFFQDYDDAWDKKGARISSVEESRSGHEGGRARSSSSPKQNTTLERRHTNERSAAGFEEGKTGGGGGGGFINRMKSLRKPRPERRISND